MALACRPGTRDFLINEDYQSCFAQRRLILPFGQNNTYQSENMVALFCQCLALLNPLIWKNLKNG